MVRATAKTVVGDAEIHHQRHRTRHIREVTRQLDVPTSLTPVPSHLMCFHFVVCAKEVRNLINHPVVILLGTRVCGTSAEVVPVDHSETSCNHKPRVAFPQRNENPKP